MRFFHLFAICIGGLSTLLVGCTSPRPEPRAESAHNSPAQTARYKKVAMAKYHDDVNFVVNPSKSHVLCVRKSALDSKNSLALKFFVYDLAADKVVYEESQPSGTVKWISDDRIEVYVLPGIVRVGKDGQEKSFYGYIYDLKLKKKLAAPAFEK